MHSIVDFSFSSKDRHLQSVVDHNNRLSHELLTSVVDSLETTQRESGGFNHLAARYAGNTSLILGFEDLADRFLRLLSGLTAEQYWSGMMTNVPRTNKVPNGARQLDDQTRINEDHPVFPVCYVPSIISESEEHLYACLTRDYDFAFLKATDELKMTEVMLTQAILGDTELAIESTKRLSEQHRKENVYLVVAIERFRCGDLDGAYEVYDSLNDDLLDIWGASQMALGIANRIPWMIYPYPDY